MSEVLLETFLINMCRKNSRAFLSKSLGQISYCQFVGLGHRIQWMPLPDNQLYTISQVDFFMDWTNFKEHALAPKYRHI